MFEFLDLFTFGRVVEAHGKSWEIVKNMNVGRYCLAIERGTPRPAQIYLIEVPSKDNEE